MGCSSCQQNNHVVPTTHVHNSTTQTHCECACGCDEPVCPTPQPCTEITDSKCIIYTDVAIKCGNSTVVEQDTSVSIALNQIVNYFCNQQGLVTTADISCGDVVIVPAGTDIQGAFELVVQFICDIQLTPGPEGPEGPEGPQGIQGPPPWTLPATVYDNGFAYPLGAAVTYQGGYYYRTGNALNPGYPPTPGSIDASWTPVADGGAEGPQGDPGISGTNSYKFVYEQLSVFGGDVITITRPELEACGLVPTACLSNDSLVDEVCDLHFHIYYLETGTWYKFPELPFLSTDEGYNLKIEDPTGDIKIQLNMATTALALRVRVVILA